MAVKSHKITKQSSRIRRAKRTRMKIRSLGMPRLSVHRTAQHIYAQLVSPEANTVLAAASTLEADIKKDLNGKTSNIDAAKLIGSKIAERAKAAGVEKVAFDRGGFLYHGRVKALADAAREQGLTF